MEVGTWITLKSLLVVTVDVASIEDAEQAAVEHVERVFRPLFATVEKESGGDGEPEIDCCRGNITVMPGHLALHQPEDDITEEMLNEFELLKKKFREMRHLAQFQWDEARRTGAPTRDVALGRYEAFTDAMFAVGERLNDWREVAALKDPASS